MIKRISHPGLLFPLLLLLCGFFWNNPTWEQVNATIDREYPSVKNIDVYDLKSSMDQGKSFVLIDVREEAEFAVSHLPTAVNIQESAAVQYSKDTPIILYCSVGVRSADFAVKLADLGFTSVLNLRGSIFAWANKSYPLVRGNTGVSVVHPYNKKWGNLLNRELHMYTVPPEEGRTNH